MAVGRQATRRRAVSGGAATQHGLAHQRQPVAAKVHVVADEVIARGGFGSPTLFVGGDDMYFGRDRLSLVREAVLRRRAA